MGRRTLNLRVQIRRNQDGVIAEDAWPHWTHDSDLTWWREGSASCDCNRAAFFNEATCLSDHPSGEPEHCSEGRYAIKLLDDATGEVLYDEFEKGGA